MRVSCSPTNSPTAAAAISATRVMTSASKSSVNPEPARAHGRQT
jgi:hypothetical protein